MKVYHPKNLYMVMTNNRERIIVKSDPDTLENMVLNDVIYEWNLLTAYKLDSTDTEVFI